mgnify:CR=1 FL=1
MNPLTLLNSLPGALAQGLIWGIMAIGVAITYKILDYADLTVDNSLCTGGAVAAVCIIGGMNPLLALLCAVLAGALAGLRIGRDLVGIAAGVDGGTGPRVGLAVQRRHFSERSGGNPHSEDESPGDDQRCMLQHGSCSFRARCPVEAKLPVECFMRMCRMQRNVTKCIGVAGKAAPCGGAGPSRVQGLRGTPDAACNQEKEKSSGRCFANHR